MWLSHTLKNVILSDFPSDGLILMVFNGGLTIQLKSSCHSIIEGCFRWMKAIFEMMHFDWFMTCQCVLLNEIMKISVRDHHVFGSMK